MGFLSRLFGNGTDVSASKIVRFAFRIPWFCETVGKVCDLSDPAIFITDVAGLKAPDIISILQKCRQKNKPLVAVTPGVDDSVMQLSSDEDLVIVKAVDLPGQLVADLLDDMAMVCGGKMLSRQLGYGFIFQGLGFKPASKSLVLPEGRWSDISITDLGAAEHVTVDGNGTCFSWARMSKGDARQAAVWAASILQDEPGAGRNERLMRIGIDPSKFPDQIRLDTGKPQEGRIVSPFRLASKYFITDPSRMECVMENAFVAVLGEPLNDVQVVVRFLDSAAISGRPVMILAPYVSDEVLAVCVLNKLRGIVLCAVAVPTLNSGNSEAALAKIGMDIGVNLMRPSGAYAVPSGDISGLFGSVREACAGTRGLSFKR